MGNHSDKPAQQQVFKSKHPLFQKAVIIKEGDKNYIQTRQAAQVKEYEAWKAIILDTKKPLNHQFLMLPEHTGFQHDKELCSNTGTAISNYPYFPINLAEEIADRKADQKQFKESQLWYLLFGLVAAKIDLKQHGYQVGDIKPQNVFINSEHNVKVVNLLTSVRQMSAFTKAKNYESTALLLAPQDFPQLVQGAIDNKNNLHSEVFSIGATILCAGLLDDDLSMCYNFEKWQFLSKTFDARKDLWAEHSKYSEIFKSIVLNLVSEDPAKRISIEDLYRFVAKYESHIKAKEQFIITHPPENLQLGVSVVRSKIHP